MKRRIAIILLAAVAGSALLVGAAGAGSASSRGAAAHPIHFTSVAQIARYLHARHISTAGMAVQRGARNYAGPSCPGAGWTCTTSMRVVQFARSGSASNKSECSPTSGGTPMFPPAFLPALTAPTQCTVIQVSTTGDNSARCVIQSTATPAAILYCAIHQESMSGTNDALVDQEIDQTALTTQSGREEASVEQYNGSGSNSLQSTQRVDQRESQQSGAPAQDQRSYIQLDVKQQSGTGRQSAAADQTAQLDQMANGQSSGGQQLQQSNVIGHVHQNSEDVSDATVRQHEDLDQMATRKSGVSQIQSGPMECCAFQGTNPNDRFNIDQTSSLNASDPVAQSTQIFGDCSSFGTCAINQFARVNGDSQNNSCSSTGSGCSVATVCGPGEITEGQAGLCSAFGAPTAVSFRTLTATSSATGVTVRWRTASEFETLGFNVYREVNGKRVRVNPKLIAAKGVGSYAYLDRKAPQSKVASSYWIRVVNLDGSRSWYGPAKVVVRA